MALDHDRNSPERSIALCLSGGGLRATFFHLGVITALREAGLLGNVREVFSVSGGSITAGHLALNWSKYTGSDKDFRIACDELRAIGDWDIRNRVIRRWVLGGFLLLPYWAKLGRTELLQGQYERLFGRKTLRQCEEGNPDAPKFHILATSFNTGDLCSFSEDVFSIHNEGTNDDGDPTWARPTNYAADNVRLSLAVAASSAFPPLFPPIRLTWDRIGASSDGAFNAIALTDGGVYDNLGFDKFVALEGDAPREAIDTVVVSDAGGAFNASIRNDFSGVFARNVRATDVLMRRTAKATLARMREMRSRRDVLYVPIGQIVDASDALVTTQTRLQNIRTDLDRFSKAEIALLVDHGRNVMDATMEQTGLASRPATILPRGSGDEAEASEELARQGGVTRARLFDERDWASYVLLAVAATIAILLMSFARGTYDWYAVYRDEKEQFAVNRTKTLEKDREIVRLEAELDGYRQQPVDISQTIRPPTPSGTGATGPQPDGGDLPSRPGRPRPPEPQSVDRTKYIVWTQFAGALTREQMKLFGSQLIGLKWNAPGAAEGGERTPNAARLNEVRYRSPDERDAAQQLADDINALKIVPTTVVTKQLGILPRNSLEIWISK